MLKEKNTPILKVENLVTAYPIKKGFLSRVSEEVKAVSGVDFEIYPGQTLGLVGESGCGKSTVARTIAGLEKAKSGNVFFENNNITNLSNKEMRKYRKDIQMIFQDPDASLNPRMTVKELISEPWEVHKGVLPKKKWDSEVKKLMDLVGLDYNRANSYPHQFSGGQKQRICIARALALKPKLIICDEAVSALDVSIQAQILNLLEDLQKEFNLSYLFISHDLSVVRYISDCVAIMYLGKIIEIGDRDKVYEIPRNPYTQALFSAAPVPDPWSQRKKKEIYLEGDLPSPVNPPSGCRFRTRCWKAQELCAEKEPQLIDRGEGHFNACHFPENNEMLVAVNQSK